MKLSQLAAKIRPGVFAELQRRIDERAKAGAPIIGLHIGDTHVSPPAAARWGKLLAELDVDSTYRYGATAALTELRDALATHVMRARGVPDLTAEHVLVGSGGTHALYCVAKAVLDPGDEVITFAPYWPLAHGIFTSVGARVVEVSVSQRAYAEPELDLTEVLAQNLTPSTKAIYFVSPNNPDGNILRTEQLMQIARFAEEHDLFVFADEVYADIAYGKKPVSFGSLVVDGAPAAARAALVYSFSKSHALAGNRVGYVIAPPAVIALARRVSVHTVFNVPFVTQRAALAALTHGAAFQEEALAMYTRARTIACDAMTAVGGARFFPPDGAAYVFVDFAELLDGRPLVTLLERAVDEGVLLAPGESFGAAFGTSARICFTSVPEASLREGLAALTRAARAQ